MKVSLRKLRRLIQEEVEHALAVGDLQELEPEEDVWSGGDNLVDPVDQLKATTDEESVKEPEVMDIIGEDYGAAQGPLDANGDNYLSPEELYAHFDLDGDGMVTVEDYIAHVKWHCSNPDAFAAEGIEPVSDTDMIDVLGQLGIVLT